MPGSSAGSLEYDVFRLSLVLNGDYPVAEAGVRQQLESFECEQSSHIQDFARTSVHRWEKHGHSRTYVLVSVDSAGNFLVPGFFTVGMTSLDLTEASTTVRKKLMGEISTVRTGAFSIAELARSDNFTSADLPGSVILDEAKSVIASARGYVGGRFLVVDSRPKIFERLYAPAGFKHVDVASSPMGMEDQEFITSCAALKEW